MTPQYIRYMAQEELREERFREAVDLEKARLRAHRSLGQRILALLPFTITWKKRT
jgi:hypothetical protein